jgi:hypothetical protein
MAHAGSILRKVRRIEVTKSFHAAEMERTLAQAYPYPAQGAQDRGMHPNTRISSCMMALAHPYRASFCSDSSVSGLLLL